MPPSDSPAAVPLQSPTAGGSEFNAQSHLIESMMARMATATLVLVKATTNSGGVSPVGFVDVQPMVAQTDGAGNAVPHGTIHRVPVFRIQGGGNAVILDPQVGDIGICIFASRDISAVKASRRPAPPGSRRRYDMADGLYMGGVLNGAPTQYVVFSAAGIKLVSPTAVEIQAPAVTVTTPTITVTGNLAVNGTVTGGAGGPGSVSLQTHQHGTGAAAAGTSAPTPGT